MSPLDGIASGAIDGALGVFIQLPPGFHKRTLGTERFVGVAHALLERGLTRHVALYVSHFLVAPLVVAETDLVATLPERAAQLLAKQLDLVFFEPPIPLSGFELVQLWHERTAASAPHVWLRGEIDRAAPRPLKARKRAA